MDYLIWAQLEGIRQKLYDGDVTISFQFSLRLTFFSKKTEMDLIEFLIIKKMTKNFINGNFFLMIKKSHDILISNIT